jgi:transposase
MAGEFWLSDEHWVRLKPLLPNKPRGVARVDDRRVINGIVHVLQSGCRWEDAPAIYGPPKALYNRNVRSAAKDVWREVFEALAAAGGPPAEVLIDSTHVKAHRSAAGRKGGLTCRRPAAVEAAATPRSTPSPTDMAARSPST